MDIIEKIAKELQIQPGQVSVTVKMIDEGNTIPFIARYRKDVTGNLNDEILRKLYERLQYLRNLSDRQEQVIALIEEQGKLTEELKAKILGAETMVLVEDLYRPYKQKRKTRAGIAKEKGLEPLAELILLGKINKSLISYGEEYVSEEKNVNSPEEALQGASDIIAESVSDNAEFRSYIRNEAFKEGLIESSVKNKTEDGVFEMYYEYSEPVKKIPGHRILALNRGESLDVLSVKIVFPEENILRYLFLKAFENVNSFTEEFLRNACKDGYKRLIEPSVEREIRNELTEKAQSGAISVFGKNLEQLLLQPPIKGKVVLGWDPAFRTGCKIAVVDGNGKVLCTTVIYPTAPQCKINEACKVVKELCAKYKVDLISVGNGTASRESEKVIADFLKAEKSPVKYVIVNEAGASVYSASELATKEFPQLSEGARSAVSIARRLQDPLAELVKIEPCSIGVGQYQHDMNKKTLSEALGFVVESCVNRVGVDLNTASVSLLEYVSGISSSIATNIVEYREKNGSFTDRKELLKVPKLGPKAFEQCAGFLRITDGTNPFDATGVHPESYDAAAALLEKMGLSVKDISGGVKLSKDSRLSDRKKCASELGIGEITLEDIIKELEKPGRDPREDMPAPILKSDVLEMDDLTPGMVLKGTVRNVIDFGAFVDIGVHQDGLVHISQITDRYIKHPLEVLNVGDVVDVKIIEVDKARKRIALTMKM